MPVGHGVGLLVFTVISQLFLITRNIHFLILFPPHPSDPIRMQLYPALDDEGLIDGDDGVELPRVWPAENVIYQLVPPPPTPAELKFTAKLALHLEETRRQNLLDIRQSPSSADFPNTTNTLYDYEKSSGHPNPATKEKKIDNPSKKEFNNEDSKTINVAAETTSTPFTTTHRDITLVSTPVSATNMTTLASSDSLGDINKRLAEALLKTTTTVTNPCTKLLKQGGRYCKRISDGDKKVCLDEILSTATKRPNGSCLVYSFGVGHDFSFDMAMSLLGCEVFAFDDDEYHSIYPVQPFPRVHFCQTRLGSFVLYQEVDNRIEDSIYTFLYRPLDNIMYILGHTEVTLHLLKVDIEGAEWDIFSKSIFETDILERTRQLALEVHMVKLLDPTLTPHQLNQALLKYTSFYEGLVSRGFRLVYQEPNYLSPKFKTVSGVTLTVCAEQLWINSHPTPTAPLIAPLHPGDSTLEILAQMDEV